MQNPCAICCEELYGPETLSIATMQNCRHQFHLVCIVPWLQNNGVCPVCRGTGELLRDDRSVVQIPPPDVDREYPACTVCHCKVNFDSNLNTTGGSHLVICDHCGGRGCHLKCFDPPITQRPRGPRRFICSVCVDEGHPAKRKCQGCHINFQFN